MSFWYLGSPYTKYADGLGEAARIAAEQAALLRRNGISVFSPIAHSHALSIASGIDPLDATFWMEGDAPIMQCAKGLIVLLMDGWEESSGLFQERTAFRAAHKPIVYMRVGSIPDCSEL